MILKTLSRLLPLLVLVFASPYAATAQNLSADETRVDFPKGEITLDEGFAVIERQTPFRFSFSGSNHSRTRRVSMPRGRYTVAEAVSRLLEGSGYTAVLHNGYYVVTPANRRPYACEV